jgi:flagellar hook assembly protein FlgD
MPNPFRASTVIRFVLPAEDRVSIRVVDAGGRRVRSLLDATLPAGPHDVSWNGRDEAGRTVASGIYFYRMESSDRREMRRMFLLR